MRRFFVGFVVALIVSASASGGEAVATMTTYPGPTQAMKQTIVDAKAEIARNVQRLETEASKLITARLDLTDALARVDLTRAACARLDAAAVSLRRDAYEISGLPGLSAAQNHASVVAMEAADTAENAAGTGRLAASLAATAVIRSQAVVDRSIGLIANLAARTAALNQIIRINGGTLDVDVRPAGQTLGRP